MEHRGGSKFPTRLFQPLKEKGSGARRAGKAGERENRERKLYLLAKFRRVGELSRRIAHGLEAS